MSELWGIWGGRRVPGWCRIYDPDQRPGPGYATLDRAVADRGLQAFLTEKSPDATYEIRPYTRYTEAQQPFKKLDQLRARLLAVLREAGGKKHGIQSAGLDLYFFFWDRRRDDARDRLFMEGLAIDDHGDDGKSESLVITTLGLKVLAEYEAKHGDLSKWRPDDHGW